MSFSEKDLEHIAQTSAPAAAALQMPSVKSTHRQQLLEMFKQTDKPPTIYEEENSIDVEGGGFAEYYTRFIFREDGSLAAIEAWD